MILVFVGAGGSAAVNPEQYPTTVEFFKRLPPEITETSLFQLTRQFLMEKKGGQPIDIEEILWAIDAIENYFSLSCDPTTIQGWMMAENRLNIHFGRGTLPGGSQPLLDGMRLLMDSQIQPLRKGLNAQVHKFYDKLPDEGELSAWVELLRKLEELDPVLEIFTTNYDRMLETAIETYEINVTDGRKHRVVTRLDTTLWDNPGKPLGDGRGRLTKLHGSVDWKRENGEIICGPCDAIGDIPIFYPGFKGAPEEEPFIKFHEHLRAVVGKARVAIFIGFAFRDEYINGILSDLPPELSTKNLTGIKKFVVSKDDSLPDLSFLGDCWHFNDGFTAEAVSECVEEVNRALMHVRRIRT